MSVQSATPPLPSRVFAWFVFNRFSDPLDFISIPDFCAHVTTLYITVTSQPLDQTRALAAISCCPNLRTLVITQPFPGRRRAYQDPVPPWPTTLHLPHLTVLRIDPRSSARFTAFVLSHCSNIRHLLVDSTSWQCNVWRRVASPPQEIELHPFPNLRTLDIFGNYRALQWCSDQISMAASNKLLRVSTPFKPGYQLSELVATRSSCKLDVTVESPFNDPQLHLALSALPRLHKLSVVLNSTEALDPQHVELALHASLRVIQFDHGPDIDPLIDSVDRWPRSLRVLILRLRERMEAPSESIFKRLQDACRSRRILLRREKLAYKHTVFDQ